MSDLDLWAQVAALAERHGLPEGGTEKLVRFAECLASDPHAPTSVREMAAIVDRHLADSLVALEVEAVRQSHVVLDLGSGAGLPGLALAAALPDAEFALLESVGRKCAFLKRAIAIGGIGNARVVNSRSESYLEGRRCHDLVTARAVASLEVTAEYAAPLLRLGGMLVIWAGRRSPEREDALRRAADELGLGPAEVRPVVPFRGARDRHLYVMSKVMETPDRFPRRPGIALKRPLGPRGARDQSRSRCSRG